MPYITKATGEKELFSEDKLRLSIQRAGIPSDLWENAVSHVKSTLYENIPTCLLYTSPSPRD